MKKTIEIFRAGTHLASDGKRFTFSEADVAASAKAYDPAVHEAPLVVGHPKHDAPAFGWVAGLAADRGRLAASARQVNADFAEQVNGGAYKKVSSSFYLPDAADNPVPGVYYLRHVGFLGAQPPSVKGLEAVQFADAGDGVVTIEFSEGDVAVAWGLRNVARAFRRLREFLIAEFGQEKADAAIEDWTVDSLAQSAAEAAAEAKPKPPGSFSEPEPAQTEDPDMTKEEQAAQAAALEARENELKQKEASFAERETGLRKRDHETFLDGLIAGGKLRPADKAATVLFMEGLDRTQTVEFAEGDAGKKTPLDFFKGFLQTLPKSVEFSEIAGAEGNAASTVDFAAPPGYTADSAGLELHAKAQAFMAKNPGTEYLAAVKAVGGK